MSEGNISFDFDESVTTHQNAWEVIKELEKVICKHKQVKRVRASGVTLDI